jgi:hypothetical protein
MKVPDLEIGKKLICGLGSAKLSGVGPTEVRGSAYIEGPSITGNPSEFSDPTSTEIGTVMCGPTTNTDMKPIPFYSLFVKTYARIKSFLKVDKLLTVELIKSKIIYTDVLMARSKNFAIQHPLHDNKILIYSCLEGPENSVYIRGRSKEFEIALPDYWINLIDDTSITVSITPIGGHHSIYVDRIENNKVYIKTDVIIPEYFYHIFAERKDIEKLQVEVNK